MDVTFMRRATAPVTMSGTAEEEDEGEEERGGSAAGRRALFRLACQLGWRQRGACQLGWRQRGRRRRAPASLAGGREEDGIVVLCGG